MLQQGELAVVRCEKEGTSGVHLDSEIRRVKWMYLFIKSAIRVANGKIVAFHLPSLFFLLRAPFGQYGPVAAT